MLQALLDSLEDDLKYAIEVEGKMSVADITNYDEVNSRIWPAAAATALQQTCD